MSEEQVTPQEPVQGQTATDPTPYQQPVDPSNDTEAGEEGSHEYHEVAEGVQARSMTEEERNQRASESEDESKSE